MLPKQLEALRSTRRLTLYRGGFGSGKSLALVWKAIQLAGINQGGDGMLVAPSHAMLTRNVLRPFLDAAKPLIRTVHKQERRIELLNGSTIFWGSTDRPETLDGANLAWYCWDEPRYSPELAQTIMIGRLRVRSAKLLQGFYATTPPSGGWLRDCFDRDAKDQADIKSSSRDNFFLHPSFIDGLESRYSAKQCAAYIDGDWTSLDGSVFPEWDRKVHAIDYAPDPSTPVLYGLDFGASYQHIVFAQYYPDGAALPDRILPARSLVVFAEDAPGNMTTEDLARRMCRRFPADGAFRIAWGACDPAGASTSSSASEHGNVLNTIAWKRALKECGYQHPKVKYIGGKGSQLWRSISTGIESMRGMLHDYNGRVTLYFSRALEKDPSGRGIIKGMETLTYAEGTQKILKAKKAGQVDHGVDALRYLVRHLKLKSPHVSQVA